ncbi:MAG: Rid family detoxifying hydrolase [Xanthomonadales bacterium]|nr:Rid family detoxifying hydrolase [Xanthomonadales bacterium]
MSDIRTERAPKPVGAYPHARRVGPLLFLSGVGPRQPGSDDIPEGIEAQTRAVFENVRTILEASGARWDQLVDVTVFLTDMAGDFATFNRIYAEAFTEAQPCRTTVEVNALPTPICVELKCIAWMDED